MKRQLKTKHMHHLIPEPCRRPHWTLLESLDAVLCQLTWVHGQLTICGIEQQVQLL